MSKVHRRPTPNNKKVAAALSFAMDGSQFSWLASRGLVSFTLMRAGKALAASKTTHCPWRWLVLWVGFDSQIRSSKERIWSTLSEKVRYAWEVEGDARRGRCLSFFSSVCGRKWDVLWGNELEGLGVYLVKCQTKAAGFSTDKIVSSRKGQREEIGRGVFAFLSSSELCCLCLMWKCRAQSSQHNCTSRR